MVSLFLHVFKFERFWHSVTSQTAPRMINTDGDDYSEFGDFCLILFLSTFTEEACCILDSWKKIYKTESEPV